MATIRPNDLPAAGSVGSGNAIIIDDGATVEKATPAQVVDAAIPLASQAEAEAGTNNTKRVTPLRVSQAIDALGVSAARFASETPGEGRDLIGQPTVSELLDSLVPPRGEGSVWHAGGFRYVEAASGATDQHLTTAGGVKLYFVENASYTLEYFGLIHEASPTTDQAPKLQAMLDFLEGKTAVISGTATVGIDSGINFKSNQTIYAYGLTLFFLSTLTPGLNLFCLVANGITNTRIYGLRVDGNSAAFGGIYPAAGLVNRAFYIYAGCTDVYFIDCVATDVNSNGFLAHGGGDTATRPKDCGFIRCVADTCGVGIGQEVLSPLSADVLNNVGPENITYDHCRTPNCNFALYIAGGSFTEIGGEFDSVRNHAAVFYVGDALAPCSGTSTGAKFSMDGPFTNPAIKVHTVAANASAAASYEYQQTLNVTLIQPSIMQADAAPCLRVETGANLTLIDPRFSGGSTFLTQEDTTFTPPSGSYSLGKTVIKDGVGKAQAGTYGFVIKLPLKVDGFSFEAAAGGTHDGILMSNGSRRVDISSVSFDSSYRNGFASGAGTTNIKVRGATDDGITGTLFNMASSIYVAWDINGSVPPNTFTDGPVPRATSSQFNDVTATVNTTADKRTGQSVYNVNLGVPVFASGGADGDTWIYATGATAHTPA